MLLTHHAHVLRVESPRDAEVNLTETEEYHNAFWQRFGIDDARALTLEAHTKPREADEKLCIVRTDFITHEAQNALLKLLEEPPETSRFLFVLPPDFVLLDTLLSRVEEILGEDEQTPYTAFDEFRALGLKERMSQIESALKQKDGEWQRAMKTGLIHWLRTKQGVPHYAELEFVARVLLTRGASNKMLFEHAALLL